MGTFGGVFTPSILTILGLILFLRLGYVVGMVGLGLALLIIATASAVSTLTSISLAAVATNIEVKGGGVYYIISRTLGLPFGGAIGLVLFVALAVSAGFYCVGFAEGITALMGTKDRLVSQAIAGAAVLAMVGIAVIGAEWATRVQYLVMALLVAALISFTLGAWHLWNDSLLSDNWSSASGWGNFWIAFAIFFPAVTGFTQGVNMSGDLADPLGSIPRGTAMAVGVSIAVYLIAALLLAATVPGDRLRADFGAMRSVASYAPLIDVGIIAATLSSALASLMGAPRILQSLAKDRVFAFLAPFAVGVGPGDNPRRGILAGGAIALAVVALGNLNLIAGVVSMFFVVTYGLLNYATYYEARGRSPSFRPGLRWYDPRISLAGGMLCLGVMLAINILAGLVAVSVVFAIYQYLKLNAEPRWADGQRSYHLQIVREHLLKAGSRLEHPRDWRPQILAFSDDRARRERLLTFAGWIEGHSGLTTAIRIIEGKGRHTRRVRANAERELAAELTASGLKAFPLVVSTNDLDAAVPIAIQAAGIGPTRVNTVLVNWLEHGSVGPITAGERRFVRNLHSAFMQECNLLILNADAAAWTALNVLEPEQRTIDVWWLDNRTGRLMLILAYLMTRNGAWRHSSIRVVALEDALTSEARREALEAVLRDVRIAASVHVIEPAETSALQVAETSRSSSLVFLGLSIRDQQFTDWRGNALSSILPTLPITVLAMAAEDLDLVGDPDKGEESERAAASDAVEDRLKEMSDRLRNERNGASEPKR